jgi:hypothetical protein
MKLALLQVNENNDIHTECFDNVGSRILFIGIFSNPVFENLVALGVVIAK